MDSYDDPGVSTAFTIQSWLGLIGAFLMMAFNLFGDGLRDALDPRAR